MNVVLKELTATNKKAALEEISNLASVETGLDAQGLLEGFIAREEQTSTGMIEGIAIPHTMQNTSEPSLVVCKSVPLLDWETLDGSAVELEIAIIAPNGGEEHLKLLSQISRKLISSENIAALKQATDVQAIKELLEI